MTEEIRRGSSVLAVLRALGAPTPRVLLRDVGSADSPVTTGTGSPQDTPDRYQIAGEIARGGMGIVLKGRDVDLGRDVAMKVIRPELARHPEALRRFVEEAQIGGQLQHPGIVPVYELGLQKDQRIYFTMKLVKGQTLAALLQDRRDPTTDRRRFLAILEQVARTVAYAHARGVIHRDLKPSNVMVGAFGEVQVFDWGFAKVLARADAPAPADESVVRTVRTGSTDEDESRAGSVMGTPAYMPPEQALGQIEMVDERADVFALGAILCEVLTGKPPYAPESGNLLVQAGQGDLRHAVARLERGAADAELVSLALDCMGAREKRPRSAAAVAERVTGYLEGVEARARAAEVETARARVQAREERRRRRLGLVGSAALLLTLVAAGTAYGWFERDRRDRALAGTVAVRDALATARGLAKAAMDPEGWARAQVAAARAVDTAARLDAAPALRTDAAVLVAAAAEGKAAFERRAAMRQRIRALALARVDAVSRVTLGHEYRVAFRTYGIDFDALADEEIVRRIQVSDIATELIDALNDWAFALRGGRTPGDLEGVERLVTLAAAADPGHVRGRAWRARLDDDAETLRALARGDDAAVYEGPTPALVAVGLVRAGDTEAALAFAREAVTREPDNLVANRYLAMLLESQHPPRHEEALAHWRAAVAASPESDDTRTRFAAALRRHGDTSTALRVLRDVLERTPESWRTWRSLIDILKERGELEAQLTRWRGERATRPTDASLHVRVAIAEAALGRHDRALEEYEKAIAARPDEAIFHSFKGNSLWARDATEAMVASYRRATELSPDDAGILQNLSLALYLSGRHEEALDAIDTAVRHQLRVGIVNQRATVLMGLGRIADAVATVEDQLRSTPNDVTLLQTLIGGLQKAGRWEDAVEPARRTLRLSPEDPFVLQGAGLTLAHEGHFAEAREALAGAVARAPTPAFARRTRNDLALAEIAAKAEPNVDAALAGTHVPVDGTESLGIAIVCRARKLLADSTRFLALAFERDPALEIPRDRYNGACTAVKAAAGRGRDENLDDDARAALRRTALTWMRRNLAMWRQRVARDATTAAGARYALTWWRTDADLASVRAASALEALPAGERDAWRAFWRDVDALLGKVGPK